MKEFRAKLSENGRIVIPVACREQLHLAPGEDLIIHVDDEEMRIFSTKHSLKKMRALVVKHAKNKNLVRQLKSMRKKDME